MNMKVNVHSLAVHLERTVLYVFEINVNNWFRLIITQITGHNSKLPELQLITQSRIPSLATKVKLLLAR